MSDKDKKPKRGAQPAPANETQSDRFKRIASLRTGNALQAIGLLTNLTTANYEYTADQADKIVAALQGAVDHVKEVFASGGKKKEEVSPSKPSPIRTLAALRCEDCNLPIGIGQALSAHVTSLGTHCEVHFRKRWAEHVTSERANKNAAREARSERMRALWQKRKDDESP